jgi:uncharacterized protein YciI
MVRLGFGAYLDFFVYSRDASGTEALRDDDELLEEHWSYMDRFTASMIARGPTFGTDRETVTGSLHVVGLTSVDAVHEFVAREPNTRAGVYAEHSIWRFENLLGHTMWEFPGAADEPKFMIIAHSHGSPESAARCRPVPLESLSTELREQLIVYGALRTPDDAAPVGVALAVQARDRQRSTHSSSRGEQGSRPFPRIEIHDWEFGGRR